jgi:hypothetical protein
MLLLQYLCFKASQLHRQQSLEGQRLYAVVPKLCEFLVIDTVALQNHLLNESIERGASALQPGQQRNDN